MNDLDRYKKQILVPYIGNQGQASLLTAKCAIVGIGALGSTVAEQLVRAGVGFIRIIDRDYVEVSNLQRQTLYTEEDASKGTPKAIAAKERLGQINQSIVIEPVIAHLHSGNIERLLSDVELIIDATDNFTTRYLINEYSVANKTPWIHGAVVSTHGRVVNFIPGQTPCFQCLFPVKPTLANIDTCDTVGVLAPIVQIIGSIQAMEAIKWLTHQSDALSDKLIQYDVWQHSLLKFDIAHSKQKECPICAKHQYEELSKPYEEVNDAVLCGRNTVQIAYSFHHEQHKSIILNRLAAKYKVIQNKYVTKIQYDENMQLTLFHDGRCLVHGTNQIEEAKSLAAKLFND